MADQGTHSVVEHSEHGAGESTATATAPETHAPDPPFNRAEIAQFDADDVKAGSVIGKMLAMFFFYTVVAMSIVAWWTYQNASH